MPNTAYKGSRLAKARSQVAVAHRKQDPVAIETARRGFATEKIVDYVTRVLAEAPPLTVEQRERIAGLLRLGASVDRQTVVKSRLAQFGGGDDAA